MDKNQTNNIIELLSKIDNEMKLKHGREHESIFDDMDNQKMTYHEIIKNALEGTNIKLQIDEIKLRQRGELAVGEIMYFIVKKYLIFLK